ncbi:1-acyl-sn-glycerol-3-phosphate acyltransferase [Formicincola oecophyllae]|uniref:1-acyl-sn-glycerol-3-phosphate acyltransferase n=1 Tax=Formicincola oecophyllae TaxID=2558361 RepID=A0A4Y6U796_9PROT|nr:lysophospholipid acyltransferase family protein [Formicincola oecophyllae]QDH12900.1 1-acyl-sn-glycerol-3-phosphate acyltransferase [Formicincola oecophyllae]
MCAEHKPAATRRTNSRPRFDPEALFPSERPTTPRTRTRRLRATGRLAALLGWGAFSCSIQVPLMALPGWMHLRWPRVFWRGVCRIMGMKVRVLGKPAATSTAARKRRPVIYVVNHTSWMDIAVLGSIMPTIFISKDEVRHWPLVGILTKLGSTLYVTRTPQTASAEISEISARLREGYDITFFPEGTTSDGAGVLPFLSSLFAIAKPPRTAASAPDEDAPRPLVQPVSLVYDQLEGLPTGRNRRSSVFSWYGDMEFGPHFKELSAWRAMRASVMFHAPLDPETFPTRKKLAAEAQAIIASGSETLRQQRLPHSS